MAQGQHEAKQKQHRRGAAAGCIVIALLLAAGALFWWLWDRVDASAIPPVSLSVAGTAVGRSSAHWQAPAVFGLLHKELYSCADNDQPQIALADAAAPALAPLPDRLRILRVQLYARDADSGADSGSVFDGTAADFAAFTFAKSGSYTLVVQTALDDGAAGSGDFRFDAVLNVTLPLPKPVFAAEPTAAKQGDLLTVTARNLPDGVTPSGESKLGYVRFVRGADGVWSALVPVGYARDPGDYTITVTAGSETATLPVTVSETAFEEQQMTISAEVSAATAESKAANLEFHNTIVPLYDTANDTRYWHGTFLQPVQGRISTPYGVKRYVNGSKTPTRHGGIDIAAARGTPVLCPNDGVVEYAGLLQLSGNTVVIEHGGGLKSYFYHMDSLSVQTGQQVTRGQQIGTVGTTGYSTGPHLHYEVKIGRESISPWPLFDGTSGIFVADAS